MTRGPVSLGRVSIDEIPTITTARLTMRPYRVDDLGPLATMWGNAHYARFIGNRTRSRAEVWQTMQRALGSWALLGYGFWCIETRSGEVIGEAGFLEGLRDLTPDFEGTPEAGWGLMPAYWGQGYASEALAAMMAWRDETLPDRRTVCIIDPDHAVSIRLAEKTGFRKLYDARLGESPVLVFERVSAASGQSPK